MAWNGSDGAATPHKERKTTPRGWRGIAAGVVIVACAGTALWLMHGHLAYKKGSTPVKSGKIADAKPDLAKRETLPSKDEVEVDSPADVTSIDKGSLEQPPKEMSPEEIEAEERRKDPLYDRHHIVAKMPLFKEPIEQLMETVFMTELGDMPPMLPAIPEFDEEKFKKVVDKMTPAEDGDTEDDMLAKGVVNQVKRELKKYLDEGGTTSGFLAYYVNELDAAFREREMCKELQMKAMKTEEPDVAREVYLKFNARLAAKGIKTLTLTRRQKEYLGIQEEQQ